jgi:hypothetical protein
MRPDFSAVTGYIYFHITTGICLDRTNLTNKQTNTRDDYVKNHDSPVPSDAGNDTANTMNGVLT